MLDNKFIISLQQQQKNNMDVIDVFINLIVIIISQLTFVSNYHIIYLKYIALFFNYTSVKVVKLGVEKIE